MKDTQTYTILQEQLNFAEEAYQNKPDSDAFSYYSQCVGNLNRYIKNTRELTLGKEIRRKEGALLENLGKYNDSPSIENYEALVSSTQAISHILTLQKALAGGVGSSMALQTLSDKYPLGIKCEGVLTRQRIKEILLNSHTLPLDQVESLMIRLNMVNEGIGELTIENVKKAYADGDINIAEANKMFAALRQEKELTDDTLDDTGKLGYIERDFYESIK